MTEKGRRSRAAATQEEVLTWFRAEHPPHAALAGWARGVLLAAEPDLSERIYRGWDGVGYHHPDAGYVCALFPRPEGLVLWFEHGGALDDPDGVLVGNGTRGRWLPLETADHETARRIRTLLDRAVAHGFAR